MAKPIEAGEIETLQLSAGKGEVVVAERGDGAFTQVMLDGRHVLLADEPKEAGGDDRGPSPYRLLLMALGSCTSMTLRLYATRKGWPVERITVRLRHFRNHAKDCKDCPTGTPQIDRIERVIDVAGTLDDEQRARLLEIAERCPVHRTLEASVRVESRLGA